MDLPVVTSAGFVIFRRIGNGIEFLLLKSMSRNWGFPKGRVEPGETLFEAALREVSEEAGIDRQYLNNVLDTPIRISYTFTYKGAEKKKNVYLFASEIDPSFPIQVSDEHTIHIWRSYEEAIKLVNFEEISKAITKVFDLVG